MNGFKKLFIGLLPAFLFSVNGFSQAADSTGRSVLLNPVQSIYRMQQDTVKLLPEITMPVYRMVPQKDKKIGFNVHASSRSDVMERRESDIQYRNPKYESINIFPKNYGTYHNAKKAPVTGLDIKDYVLPTREEYEVLQILWDKGDILDTAIYSYADTSLNTTMMLLNQTLENMVRKGLLSREMVSPRFEFNAFGVPIEMSELNRKNRIYSYHNRVDKNKLMHFISSKRYEVTQDSSLLKNDNLKTVRTDSTLLYDLNLKMLSP